MGQKSLKISRGALDATRSATLASGFDTPLRLTGRPLGTYFIIEGAALAAFAVALHTAQVLLRKFGSSSRASLREPDNCRGCRAADEELCLLPMRNWHSQLNGNVPASPVSPRGIVGYYGLWQSLFSSGLVYGARREPTQELGCWHLPTLAIMGWIQASPTRASNPALQTHRLWMDRHQTDPAEQAGRVWPSIPTTKTE